MRSLRPLASFRHLWMGVALLCPLVVFSAPHDVPSGVRLLNAKEGRTLVSTAWEQREQIRSKPDCSHLVHQIYELSGFAYPYANSLDLYDGIDSFRRVYSPHPGDLVVWRGHVGMVVDPVEHTFYSSLQSGLRTEYFDGPYWRAQGRPRFYRYVLPSSVLTASNASVPTSNAPARAKAMAPAQNEIAESSVLGSILPTKVDAPTTSPRASSPSNRPGVPPSRIMVVVAAKRPTNEEVGEAISEFNSSAGNLLRGWPAVGPERTVEVYDQLSVERMELQRDRGWVVVDVAGKLSIGGERLEEKQRNEKLRWEIRRTPQGWQVLAPGDRAYVSRDVAVRFLAEQLAVLTQNQAASDNVDRSLHQQGVIVRALGSLFDAN